MASWIKPRFPLPEVDEAGRVLIGKDVALETLDRAYDVINNWRSVHAYPLNSLQIVLSRRAREVQPSALVSRRIKRLPAIHAKLRRMRSHSLTPSEMQDIGGCRAVVGSVRNVEALVAMYKQERRGALHVLDDEDDYIQNPKKSGYRSAHLIYRYKARGRRFRDNR